MIGQRRLSADDLRHVVARYDGGIAYTDAQLARLFASLERRGLLASTLVVVTSDHGEEFLEHGSLAHWQTYFRPNLHVPLFFFMPGRTPRRIDSPVELIDVVPTVLELLGLPPRSDVMGRSLVPLMKRNPHVADQAAYAEPTPQAIGYVSPWFTVVTAGFQLLYDPGVEKSMLFDIRSDPAAKVDVAAREPEVARTLVAELARRREWAAEVARRTGTPAVRATPDDHIQRELRALGYVQ